MSKKKAAKKVVKKKKPAKKPVAKPQKVTAKATVKTTAKTKAVRKPAKPTSVDGVLKKFSKERTTLEASLVSIRKKIADSNSKIESLQEQVVKLTEKELVTEQSISQLDQRRNAEVSELLNELGVKIESTSSATSSTPESKPKKPAEKSQVAASSKGTIPESKSAGPGQPNSPFASLLSDNQDSDDRKDKDR